MLSQASQVQPQDIKAFLKFVTEGEQEQAEALLKKTPALALVSGNVVDLSRRHFTDITGFQYSIWALDWHMWSMIKKYMSKEALIEQIQSLEAGLWTKQHGTCANWQALLNGLEKYLDNYNVWNVEARIRQWVKIVGKAQLLLPAHVINEYCHPMRSFNPCPDFTKSEINGTWRRRKTTDGDWFTTDNQGCGEGFAWVRGYWENAGWGYAGNPPVDKPDYIPLRLDKAACTLLYNIRIKQRNDLIFEVLRPDIQFDIKQLQVASPRCSSKMPISFEWMYNFEPEPGPRFWKFDGTTWIENYLSGSKGIFSIVGRGQHRGCAGTIAQDEGKRQAFIPDIGSKEMWAWIRGDKNSEWTALNQMEKVLSSEERLKTLFAAQLQVKELLESYKRRSTIDITIINDIENFSKKLQEACDINPVVVSTLLFDTVLKDLMDQRKCLAFLLKTSLIKVPSTREPLEQKNITESLNLLAEDKQDRADSQTSSVSSSITSLTPSTSLQRASGILHTLQGQLDQRASLTMMAPSSSFSSITSKATVSQELVLNNIIQGLECLEQEKKALEATNAGTAIDLKNNAQQMQRTLQQDLVKEKEQWHSLGQEQEHLQAQIIELQKALLIKTDKKDQDRIKAELLRLTDRLTGVESQVAILMVEYEIKAKKREALQRFQNHANLLLFYRTVHIKLEEVFISMKAVAGGFVNPVEGNLATAKSIIEGLGDMVSIAPIVGSAVEKVLKWGVSKVLGKIDDTRQNNTAANASALVTLSEVKKIAESVARQLTENYAEQLLMLATLEDEQDAANRFQVGITKAKSVVLKQTPFPPAKQLASFAVLWITDVIYDAHNIKDESLDILLLAQVRQKTPPNKVMRFWNEISAKLGIQGVRTTKGDFWPPEEVFTMPGVKVKPTDDKVDYYTNSNLNPQKYGWRLGTIADVQTLKLSPTSNPGQANPDPVSAKRIDEFSRQVHVNELKAAQAQRDVELLRKENEELKRKQIEEREQDRKEREALKHKQEAFEAQTQEKLRAMEAQFAAMQATSKRMPSFSASSSSSLTPKHPTVYVGLPHPKSPRISQQDKAFASLVIAQVRSVFPQASANDFFYYTNLSGEAAVTELQNQPLGTFLIRRYSEKTGIIISYVDDERNVQHTLLIHKEATQFTTVDNQVIELAALLRDYQHAFVEPLGSSNTRRSASYNQ